MDRRKSPFAPPLVSPSPTAVEISQVLIMSHDSLCPNVPPLASPAKLEQVDEGFTFEDHLLKVVGVPQYNGSWSVTLNLTDETGVPLILKAMRSKYHPDNAKGSLSAPTRFVKEVYYQKLAGEDAPQVISYGWCYGFAGLPEGPLLYILMERKEMTLEAWLSGSPTQLEIASVREKVKSLYKRLGDMGLHLKDISSGNVVMDNSSSVFAIDFDAEDSHVTYDGEPVCPEAQQMMQDAVDDLFEMYM